MHYIGMAAMVMDAKLYYQIVPFSLSVLIAVAASSAALMLAFSLARKKTHHKNKLQFAAAIVMGAAICGMHYTGMSASVMVPFANCRYAPDQDFSNLAHGIAAVSGIVLSIALAFSLAAHEMRDARDTEYSISFPVKLISLSKILTISTMVIFAMGNLNFYKLVETAHKQDELVADISDEIMIESGLISYYARMATMNDSMQWHDEYEKKHALIQKNMKAIARQFDDPAIQESLKAAMLANNSLRKIEEESFALATKDKDSQAYNAINDKQYIEARQDYINKLKTLVTNLRKTTHKPLDALTTSATQSLYYTAMAITAILVVWFFIIRMIMRWQGQLRSAHVQMKEKQQFLDTIVDNIPLAIFAKDVKSGYRTTLWNRAAENLFEIPTEKIIGTTDYDMFQKEEADFFRQTDITVMENGVTIVPAENVTTKRGTWIARTIKVPIYDAQGNPEILLGILEDITPAKRKEETLQNYARQLEEQQGQLIEAIKLAEQANILKTQFLANMSHELRTPMHSIITFARQGAERIAKWSLDDHLENLTLIRESGERLLALLNDLLDLSKLEAGAVVYDFVENDLVALAKQATTELNSLAEEKNIILILQPDEAAMPARCDRSKIMQIIINLLSNAIKFTPDGKLVTIRITEDKAPEGYIYLKVIDQGVGIPPDELEKIFDKFIQSSKTRTGAGGTGLGLAICREIALAHNGSIVAANNPDVGASFTLTLPKLAHT
jgi:PAS domain S-box-containing protein